MSLLSVDLQEYPFFQKGSAWSLARDRKELKRLLMVKSGPAFPDFLIADNRVASSGGRWAFSKDAICAHKWQRITRVLALLMED
jgi:hypothetical protein